MPLFYVFNVFFILLNVFFYFKKTCIENPIIPSKSFFGIHRKQLESSQSPHTSAKAMLFARWQHHLRFRSGLPYAPLKAMVTKISK